MLEVREERLHKHVRLLLERCNVDEAEKTSILDGVEAYQGRHALPWPQCNELHQLSRVLERACSSWRELPLKVADIFSLVFFVQQERVIDIDYQEMIVRLRLMIEKRQANQLDFFLNAFKKRDVTYLKALWFLKEGSFEEKNFEVIESIFNCLRGKKLLAGQVVRFFLTLDSALYTQPEGAYQLFLYRDFIIRLQSLDCFDERWFDGGVAEIFKELSSLEDAEIKIIFDYYMEAISFASFRLNFPTLRACFFPLHSESLPDQELFSCFYETLSRREFSPNRITQACAGYSIANFSAFRFFLNNLMEVSPNHRPHIWQAIAPEGVLKYPDHFENFKFLIQLALSAPQANAVLCTQFFQQDQNRKIQSLACLLEAFKLSRENEVLSAICHVFLQDPNLEKFLVGAAVCYLKSRNWEVGLRELREFFDPSFSEKIIRSLMSFAEAEIQCATEAVATLRDCRETIFSPRSAPPPLPLLVLECFVLEDACVQRLWLQNNR